MVDIRTTENPLRIAPQFYLEQKLIDTEQYTNKKVMELIAHYFNLKIKERLGKGINCRLRTSSLAPRTT